jgi:FkbM family methyltransferase
MQTISHKHTHGAHHREDNIKEYLDSIPKDAIFYDLGANLGWFSLYMAERVSSVYAFEVDKINFVGLTENLQQNPHLNNVNIFNVGIADEKKTVFLNAQTDDSIGDHHKTLQLENYSGPPEIVKTNIQTLVEVDSLDNIITSLGLPYPTHLKVDIDGSEYAFLVGSPNALRNAKSLIIEFFVDTPYYQKSIDLLESYGFFMINKYSIPFETGIYNFVFEKRWDKKGRIFDKSRAQLPVVDIYPDRYRIYYSTRNNDGKSIPMYIEVDKENPSIILTEQTNVGLELGKHGSFDWAGIMPTAIISVGNLKYLYYIGWSLRKDVPYHNCLGLATSNDNGTTWEKVSLGPIMTSSINEPGYIGTVDVLIEDGIWKMWYLSCRTWIEHDGRMEPTYDIKYATSSDGISWTPSNITCIPLCDTEGGISAARVVKKRDVYHMWFSVRGDIDYRTDSNKSYRIQRAISIDGINWERVFTNEIKPSDEGWDSFMVCYPYIIIENDKELLFYNGNNFGETGVGYAVR